jgi:hypothetical protein
MQKISTVILLTALIGSAANAQDTSPTASKTNKTGGLGHDAQVAGSDVKKGTVGVFKDLGKGVKAVGKGIDKGAKATVKGTEKGASAVGSDTEKGLSKLKPHQKAPATSVPATSQ